MAYASFRWSTLSCLEHCSSLLARVLLLFFYSSESKETDSCSQSRKFGLMALLLSCCYICLTCECLSKRSKCCIFFFTSRFMVFKKSVKAPILIFTCRSCKSQWHCNVHTCFLSPFINNFLLRANCVGVFSVLKIWWPNRIWKLEYNQFNLSLRWDFEKKASGWFCPSHLYIWRTGNGIYFQHHVFCCS